MKKRNKYNRLKTPLVQLAMNYNKMMKKKIYVNSKNIWFNVEGLIFKSTNIMNYQGQLDQAHMEWWQVAKIS